MSFKIGIGSTGYQCIKMKSGIRKSVLVELNSDYWTDGIRHCTAEEYKQMTPTLFDCVAEFEEIQNELF